MYLALLSFISLGPETRLPDGKIAVGASRSGLGGSSCTISPARISGPCVRSLR